jgi:signal transduction histidine kinase
MSTPTTRKPPTKQPPAREAASIEQQFSKLSQQLEQLKTQVRQAQQLAALGTAAATIAHETNNLITPIVAYADTALSSGDVELMKKALAVVGRNARILIKMSERVLEISAAKSARREPVSVRGVIDDALASMCRDFAKDGIGVKFEVSDNLNVLADSLQLQQVFFNLFLNAREAMAPLHSGRLSVTAIKDAEAITIRVHNSGPPIPTEILPTIFDALQTTKPAEKNGKRRCGGLGLALCRDLVAENDGTIAVESSAQTGTTFTLRLPSA